MSDAAFPDGMLADIERFLTEVHLRLRPGLDLYPEVFETDLFFPLQRQAELAAMMRIARRVGSEVCKECGGSGQSVGIPKEFWDGCRSCLARGFVGGPRTVMEIGADKGGGLYHWCQCLPTVERVIACEVRGTPYKALFERTFHPKIDFLWLDGPSLGRFPWGQSVPSAIDEWLIQGKRRNIDVLFIDGDKGAFLQDFDAYLPLMSPRGVVFMHDVNEPGSPMRRAFETVKARGFRAEVIVDTRDWEESRREELLGRPARNPHDGWLRHWRGRSCGVGVIWMEGKR